MSSPPYVNDKYTTRASAYTDNARTDNKYSRYRQQSHSTYSSPSINTEDGATTPSFSENARTPTRGISRLSSCRVSMSDFSETSSTRAATPPPVNSVNVSLNREICSQSTTCGQLINLAVSKGHVFNAVNWATCLHRLAKLFPTEAKNHRLMVIRFLGQAHEVLLSANEGCKFQPQHLATLLWAMAKLSIVDSAFVADLVAKALDGADSLKAQDMANIAWSLAKMGISHPAMFKMICTKISNASSIITQFKPMEIASTTWAFGTVGRAGMGVPNITPVIEALASECLSRDLRDFSPQALANVLWALSKLQYNCSSLFSAFGSHIVSANRLREFKPQEIANVVWAMNHLHIFHEVLFHEIVSSRVINWAVFDAHALATVFGGVMDCLTLDFSLTVANRVLQKKTQNNFTVCHCGLFLAGLSSFLNNPVIGAACSSLTERLLSEEVVAMDLHALKGLLQTLPNSEPVIELLGNVQLVEAEYGSAQQVESGLEVLRKLPLCPLRTHIIALISQLEGVSLAALLELITLGANVAKFDDIEVQPAALIWLAKLVPSHPEICLQLVPRFETVAALTPGELALLVRICNNLDSPSLVGVMISCLSKMMSCTDIEALSEVVYWCSEYVSRHEGESVLRIPAQTLNRLLVQVVLETQVCRKMPLATLAQLIVANYSLEMVAECRQVVAAAAATTLLGQCCQSGPGGLVLLRENLSPNFSLYCKVLAAFLTNGFLPSSWVTPVPALAEHERSDPASLAGALSLSVALGTVGAAETQGEIIASWVLPLMGNSAAENIWSFSPFFAPRQEQQDDMPPGFLDPTV